MIRPLEPADKEAVQKKLKRIKQNLDMYDKYEYQVNLITGKIDKIDETLTKIHILRKDKAREVLTILKKYGWLSENDIGSDYYRIIIEAISYGSPSVLIDIVPFAQKAHQIGSLSDEDYNMILDGVNLSKEHLSNNTSKTLK